MECILFDLDQTLVDSTPTQAYRDARDWQGAYRAIPDCTLFDGIQGALESLSGRVHLGIVTNCPRLYTQKVVDHFGFPIDHLTCWHDTSDHKPHPAPIQHAVTILGVDVSQTAYVGDSASDIWSIRRAGGTSVAALWGAEDVSSLISCQPEWQLEHPEELMDLLKG